MERTKTLRAVATLVGTTIGAGIFGLPYAISRAGWVAGSLLLVGFGWVTIIINLAFGEVILRTKGDRQLSGYGEIYFGRWGKIAGFVALAVGVYGAMLAYTTQIGNFLHTLMPGVSAPALSVIFFVFGAFAIFRGIKSVSELELLFTILIILLVGVIAVIGWPEITDHHLNFVADNPDFLTPYGVIMFALAGSSVVPEVEEIIRDHHKKLWIAIFFGTLIPLLIYGLFTTVVIGVSGTAVSQDAIPGLIGALPNWLVDLGAILGITAMTTSFISLGFVLRELYFRDFEMSNSSALFLALAPVITLFFLGARSFINLIQFTGILTGGLTGTMILALFLKARTSGTEEPDYILPLPRWTVYFLIGVFTLGVVARIMTL